MSDNLEKLAVEPATPVATPQKTPNLSRANSTNSAAQRTRRLHEAKDEESDFDDESAPQFQRATSIARARSPSSVKKAVSRAELPPADQGDEVELPAVNHPRAKKGKLVLHVYRLKDLKGVNKKFDLYLKMKLGDYKAKTRVCKGQVGTAVVDATCEFLLTGDELKLDIYAQHPSLLKDENIGIASIPLTQLLFDPETPFWQPLEKGSSKKKVGEIKIACRYIDASLGDQPATAIPILRKELAAVSEAGQDAEKRLQKVQELDKQEADSLRQQLLDAKLQLSAKADAAEEHARQLEAQNAALKASIKELEDGGKGIISQPEEQCKTCVLM